MATKTKTVYCPNKKAAKAKLAEMIRETSNQPIEARERTFRTFVEGEWKLLPQSQAGETFHEQVLPFLPTDTHSAGHRRHVALRHLAHAHRECVESTSQGRKVYEDPTQRRRSHRQHFFLCRRERLNCALPRAQKAQTGGEYEGKSAPNPMQQQPTKYNKNWNTPEAKEVGFGPFWPQFTDTTRTFLSRV